MLGVKIEGTMSFLIGDRWIDAQKGSFVLVPGDFEPNMSPIMDWFSKNPPKNV